MNAEEILRNKINSHSWGYSYENIQSTEGFANDFLNIALAAMETYKEQSSDAVEFANWISTNEYTQDKNTYSKDSWFDNEGELVSESTKELYNEFKKSKP